ncbi:acetylcholinesterase isoform X1 [Apodemus sylvaticus]|uniref:acetylcholinesterase isoform X1 n=1 Tax=Apodemus sylvaticus TaxID=10129 RepID=UPI002243A8FB|nr:acetylcholinesterase isoform X1 [Apodemus sylvaticus]XP_052024994.1 acetylcholinesterase isoform X1 [Apodemus sylvaticus]
MPVPAVMRPPWCPLHTPSLVSPLLLLLLSVLGGGAGAEGQEDPQLLVRVRGGQLRGIRLKAPGGPVSAFLGIPFAEPPVGSRRFMPPEPKRPWSGVLEATTFQNVCYQYVDTLYPGFEGTEMWNPNRELSEDCLYLNVWTPYPRPTSPTPVLVWIYGGGFYSGASSLDVYDGRFLAQVEGTVLVSMNYRVGTFGFLALPGSREAPGNVGLLDQRLALQWVQENIAAFGGDPMSVTLFGESAGAASVGMHILSLPSRSLFHRAVLQSGTPNGPWATVSAGEARRRATLLARLVGCPPGGAGGNDTELIACLRTRPAQDLVDHEWHVLPQESIFRFSFVPVVDGDFLSDTPEALINTGDFQDLQVLVGVVKDEGSYFLVYGVPGFSKDNESLISRAQFLAGVRIGVPQASDLAAEAVVLHYTDWLHPEDPAHLRDAMSAVVGDHNVVCPVAQLAGRLAAQGARVYAYVFEHRASTLTWPPWMGVPHGYEIEFIFGLPLDPSLNYTVEERIFAQRLMKYWTNFARTGDPNDPRDSKSPQWPPYTTAAQQYVSLSLKPLEVRRGLRAQTCAFWNRFLPKLLSATGRRVGWGSREGTRRQGLEGGEREGLQNTGCNPGLLHPPQPRRLPAPAQAPPTGRLPGGPGPTCPCPSSSSFSSSTPGFRGSNYNPFPSGLRTHLLQCADERRNPSQGSSTHSILKSTNWTDSGIFLKNSKKKKKKKTPGVFVLFFNVKLILWCLKPDVEGRRIRG